MSHANGNSHTYDHNDYNASPPDFGGDSPMTDSGDLGNEGDSMNGDPSRNMPHTNGNSHTYDHNNYNTSNQALGGDSPMTDPEDFINEADSINGDLSHANGTNEVTMQDTDISDGHDDMEDAMGEDDDDYDEEVRQQNTSNNDKRLSLSSEGSSGSSKRKRNVVVDDEEEEHMLANPELYGLRRSGRARPTRRLTESSDEDDDDVVHIGTKRQKASKRKTTRRAASSEHNASPAPQLEDDDDDDDDVYDGRRAHSKVKKSHHHDGTPQLGEVRFSTRRTAKVATYNEDDEENAADEDDAEYSTPQDDNATEDVSPAIDVVLNHRLKEDAELDSDNQRDYEYFIKWQDEAHIHATWETWTTLSSCRGWRRRDNYFKKVVLEDIEMNHDPDTPPEERERWLLDRETKLEELTQFQKVERVIGRRNTVNGIEYLVKWKALYYDACTWEPAALISDLAQDELDKYLDRASRLPSSDKKQANPATRSSYTRVHAQPAYVTGGTLREFQLTGINFLMHHWCKANNVILADEMGLGKTVQTVSFCNWLLHERGQEGPFIVVAPLSTLPAWSETFAFWAPDINVVVYNGNEDARRTIREYEMFVDGNPRRVKFNILLTTYEYVNADVNILSQVKWQFLAVDEAHRLKNRVSLLYSNLLTLGAPSRLLITGTPMQNELSELSALMDFIMPGKIQVDAKLDLTDVDATSKIAELIDAISPYMIRRTKKKVESDLPGKTEKIIRIELSDTQLELYKHILARNYSALNSGGSGSHKMSLLNIVMELKKASNHAFLFPNTEEKIVGDGLSREDHLKALIQNSGKVIVLDRLLTKLKKEGHRVLIFSQMVGMLNILSEYMGLRGHQYQRLDGTISSGARKLAIDHFNAPDSEDFAFLLSTRAGGLGINLMTADTVILFDSDWNPQADLQAMARAHRIGQKKPVSVYRFVSKDTIEEEILERARNKLMLEFITIQRGVTDKDAEKELTDRMTKAGANYTQPTTADDISRILKKRGQKMFEQTGNQKKLEEIDIDDVLANAEVHQTEQPESITADGGEDFLRSFEYTDVKLDIEWDDIIPKTELEKIKVEENERLNQEYLKSVIEENAPRKRKAQDDGREQRAAKKRARVLTAEAIEDVDSDDDSLDPARPLDGKECRNLVKAYERFGSMDDMEKEIMRDARLVNRDVGVVKSTLQQILDQADHLLKEEAQRIKDIETLHKRPATKKERKTVLFDFNGVKRLNAETLKERPGDLTMIRSEVSTVSNDLNFRIPAASKSATYSCPWGAREDGMLIAGIARHGYGAWYSIRDDPQLGLTDKLFLEEHRVGNKAARNEADEKNAKSPGAVHLVRRVAYLINVMHHNVSLNADANAKRALDNHRRGNRKTVQGRISTPHSDSSLARPVKKGAKDQKREKVAGTKTISKSDSVRRRLSNEREASRHSNSSDAADARVTWDAKHCDRVLKPVEKTLVDLSRATKKRTTSATQRLELLKACIVTIGDHITLSCKDDTKVSIDTLWKHVARFHWPNRQRLALDDLTASIQKQYKRVSKKDTAEPADTTAPPADLPREKSASVRPGTTGNTIRAADLPSFQRAPRPVNREGDRYRDRHDDRRDNRATRRSRSRSPRRERSVSASRERRRDQRREPRQQDRETHRNVVDVYRPGSGAPERPPSRAHAEQGRRDRDRATDSRRDYQHGHERPARHYGGQDYRPMHRDGPRDHRRSTSSGSNRSNPYDNRRRPEIDSYRPRN